LQSASCMACLHSVPTTNIHDELRTSRVPRCSKCTHPLNLVKPDLNLAGELARSHEVEARLAKDIQAADLLVVLGADLSADPLRSVPTTLAHSVPRLLISPAAPPPADADAQFDVELIGACDVVVAHLGGMLGWELSAAGSAAASTNGHGGTPQLPPDQPTTARLEVASAHRVILSTSEIETEIGAPGSNGGGPPSAPIATQTPLTPLHHGKPADGRTRQKRSFSAFLGANSLGSGVGARRGLQAPSMASAMASASQSAAGSSCEADPLD
jgi:hypothetical protein